MRLFLILAMVFLTGCTSTQLRKEFFGISPADVTAARNKHTKVLNIPAAGCFDKTGAVLKEMKASVIKQDRKNYFIVADRFETFFHSCVDTTQVGIVFKGLAADKTQVEAASDNHDLAGSVAQELFKKLEE